MTEKLPVSQNLDWWPSLLDPLKTAGQRLHDFFSPTAEASAKKDCYEIVVELPGVDQKDIEITLNDDILLIRGEKHSEKEEEGKSYYFSERTYGSFQRSFRVPGTIKADAIQASFDKGLLHINLPKTEDSSSTARKIEIGNKH